MRKNIIILLLLLAAPLCCLAQTGLHIDELFQGRIIPQERMVETRVRGKSIAKYQLSFYRSLRLSATDKEAGQLRQLLGQDTEQSIDMRTSRQNPHRWDTWTCKLQMPPSARVPIRFPPGVASMTFLPSLMSIVTLPLGVMAALIMRRIATRMRMTITISTIAEISVLFICPILLE